jgi:hypothetical protein
MEMQFVTVTKIGQLYLGLFFAGDSSKFNEFDAKISLEVGILNGPLRAYLFNQSYDIGVYSSFVLSVS